MSENNTPVIELKGVTKKYNGLTALKGVDLKLEEGKIVGLLGRNGAGKSTLLNLINTLRFPTEGSIEVYGETPYENEKVLSTMCLIREQNQFQGDLKGKVILKTAEAFYTNFDRKFAEEMVEIFGLDLKKRFKTLSRGMQSAMGIAVGLASRAEITMLDEPSLGLDVVARQRFYDLLLEDYTEHPRTIILSTHLIDEVSKLFEEVIFLDEGKVTRQEDAETLRSQAQYLSGREEAVLPWLENREVLHRESFGATLIAAVYHEFTPEEKQSMKQQDIEVSGIPLQKLFIYLSQKTLSEQEEEGEAVQ